MMKRTALSMAALLAVCTSAAALAQDSNGPVVIDAQAWRRFVAAAAPVSAGDGERVFLYDFATRCAAFPDKAKEGAITWRLSAGPGPAQAFGLGRMLREGFDDLTVLRADAQVAEGDCAGRIGTAYGAAFTQDATRLGAIVRHGVAVLRGADIEGADRTAINADIANTEEARRAIARKIAQPILLGTRSNAQHVILILGDPTSSARWFVQYGKLANGGWRFEGAYDAPYLRS